MWPIGSTDPGFRQTRPRAGYFSTPCASHAARRAASRTSADPGACGFEWDGLRFGVAERSLLAQIAALIERTYGRRGYRTTTVARRAESAHRIAFAGVDGERLFATLTLGLDSTDGLLVDELYRTEVDVFRKMKRKICELSAFAIDTQYSSHGVLACLFRLAYLYCRSLHQATDAFIEVNPRHAGFYERVFHFRRIGEIRTCPRVDAPAVLLHLDLEDFDAWQTGDGESAFSAAHDPAHGLVPPSRGRRAARQGEMIG